MRTLKRVAKCWKNTKNRTQMSTCLSIKENKQNTKAIENNHMPTTRIIMRKAHNIYIYIYIYIMKWSQSHVSDKDIP